MNRSQIPVAGLVDSFLNLIEKLYQDLDKSTFDEVALDLMISLYELPERIKFSHSWEINMLVSVIKTKNLPTLKTTARLILGKEANPVKENTAALAVGLLENLITTLSQVKPTEASDPVAVYIQITRDLIVEDPSLFHKIEPINSVLKSYGWKDGTFLYPPKLELLVENLRAVLLTGRPPLKRSNSMTDSQKLRILRSDPLVMSAVTSLIQDVLSPSQNLDKAIVDYFDFFDALTMERPEVKAEVAPVTKILLDYGWTPKGFVEPIDRAALGRDLKIIAGELKV